jgi:4-amino-4-deoxy-L-arabinose transferase-like glycosyltransferase
MSPSTVRRALLLLAALTVTRLVVAALLPLSADEAYYWVWSRALAPGYPDHPPMVAVWIFAGTALLGDTALGVRLLAPLAAAAGSILLADAAEKLLPGRRAGIAAAAMLNATLLFGVGSVTMTPDTPLLLFWTATLWALARLHASRNGRWWLAAGVAAGLGLDSKYTAVLLAPAILLWLLAVPAMRRWFWRWQLWAAAALAALLFALVVAWNAGHGWVSFARQGGRAGDWRPARAAQFLAELVGGQAGLATPLLAVLLAAGTVWALRRAWRGDPAATLLAALSLLPAAVFVQHAFGDRVQANWPCVCYPAAAIAAAGLGGPAIGLGAALTLLAWMQAVADPVALPRRLDPALIRLGGWPGLGGQVQLAARREAAAYVATDNYGLAAMLAWLLPRDLPVAGTDPRWALFNLPQIAPIHAGPGLVVRSLRNGGPLDPQDWVAARLAARAIRERRGILAETYDLYRVVASASLVLPALPHRR